jgi:uncharacterized protein
MTEYRRIRNGGSEILFSVDTCGIFRPGKIVLSILDLLSEDPTPREVVVESLSRRYGVSSVEEALNELERAGFIHPASDVVPDTGKNLPGDVPLPPFSHLVMNISHRCNLRCRYCYADGGRYGGTGMLMKPETAVDLVDYLMEESKDDRVLITFFGGEPLLNLPAIRSVVDRGRSREKEFDRRVDFALTTNGTLLDEDVARYLAQHDIRLTVSIDGPMEVHNRNRVFPDGRGSYNLLASHLTKILNRCRIPARTTLTKENIDVVTILDHLLALGFTEVGFAPVDTTERTIALEDFEMERVMEGFERLTERFLQEALQGRVYGFTNIVNLLKLLHRGDSKALPCGAGLKLASASPDGVFSLCHRFSGNEDFRIGDVRSGMDDGRRRALLEASRVDEKAACRTCWARHLCGGGCYYLGHLHNGDVQRPHEPTCAFLRRWYEYGIRIYATLIRENPNFLVNLAGTELNC